MAKKRFYPSTPKKDADWQSIKANTQSPSISYDLSIPTRFNDERVNAVHNEWAKSFADSWVNSTANIGANNAIVNLSQFINARLPYAECAFLANDTIINNALSKISNEILRKGGEIKIDDFNGDSTEIVKALESRLKELNFWQVLNKAIVTSLTYGGALIFVDTNTDAENLDKPLYATATLAQNNKIQHLRVIEPYLCGAIEVNTSNPLNKDFMRPSKWFVSGGGTIDKTRLLSLAIYQAPDMLKPLYNYLGISLCQFMRDYVMSADVSRQALSDIFLRFRTIIIQSDLPKINAQNAVDRVAVINKQRNNAGTLLLTNDEKYYETITPLSGLDKLIAQMQENIAVSARMPAVKLLGLTPSGFNATGDFDLKSYYDEIMSLQNAIIKPFIDKIMRYLALEIGFDLYPSFEFEPLNSETALNEAQINSTEANTINTLIQAGVITQEQGFAYLQSKEIIPKNEKFSEDAEVDFDLDMPSEDINGENQAESI